jgi:rhodanese-related sulfurtransferase
MMGNLNLSMPTHITEALRTNLSGGRQWRRCWRGRRRGATMSMAQLRAHRPEQPGLVVLDVRERDAYQSGHIPAAALPARTAGTARQRALPDPTRRIVTCCQVAISTLAAATLRQMGFKRAVALDGGMQA